MTYSQRPTEFEQNNYDVTSIFGYVFRRAAVAVPNTNFLNDKEGTNRRKSTDATQRWFASESYRKFVVCHMVERKDIMLCDRIAFWRNTRVSGAGRFRIAHLCVPRQLATTCHVSFLATPDTDHRHKFSLTNLTYLSDNLTNTHKIFGTRSIFTLQSTTAVWRINTYPISHIWERYVLLKVKERERQAESLKEDLSVSSFDGSLRFFLISSWFVWFPGFLYYSSNLVCFFRNEGGRVGRRPRHFSKA